MMRKTLAIVALLLVPAMAHAEEAGKKPEKNCDLQQEAQLVVSLRAVDKSATGAVQKLDEKTAQVETIAREAALTSFKELSANYTISQGEIRGFEEEQQSAEVDTLWRAGGQVNYLLEPVEKAAVLAESLSDKGFKASVNIRKSRDRGCRSN